MKLTHASTKVKQNNNLTKTHDMSYTSTGIPKKTSKKKACLWLQRKLHNINTELRHMRHVPNKLTDRNDNANYNASIETSKRAKNIQEHPDT